MEECYFCKKESNNLFKAIYFREGIVNICEICSKKEGLPLVKKPTTNQLKQAEEKTYRQRVKEFERCGFEAFKKSSENSQKEIELKDLIEQNFKRKVKPKEESKIASDLVNNFHWLIMRERRKRKISQKDLAKEIGESEIAIKMSEQGKLPEDGFKLIKKIETYLNLKLIKNEKDFSLKEVASKKPEEYLFDKGVNKELTIDDLRKLDEEKEFDVNK